MEQNNRISEIGDRIKDIRKQKGFTLQQLSEKSGLSIGYLSNLERNVNSPTLDYLQRICEVLNINIIEILEKSPENKLHIKKDERRVIYEKEEKVKYELITEGEKDIKGICMTIEEGVDYKSISWGHNSDELGVITKGTMEIETAENKYVLKEGDSFYLYANSMHTYRNIGKGECVSYWVSIDKE